MKNLSEVRDDLDVLTKRGALLPNFDGLTPLETHTFSIAASSYYRICSIPNTGFTDASGFDDTLLFRVTVTGTGIHEVADVFVQGCHGLGAPVAFAINRTLSTTAGTTGVRYLRFNYPKALNSGYDWQIEFAAYNATARTVRIDVFGTSSRTVWASALTASTYNSDYQSSTSMTLYTNRHLCILGTVPVAVSSASSSTYISGYLPLFTGGTQPVTGEAITANTLVLMSGNKVYKASNKTVPINPEQGLAFCSNATNNNTAVTYNYIRQKASWTTLTGDSSMTKGTIAKGNPVYLRCTMSGGSIYSDAYMSNTMAAGYTWCYVGTAQSASAINVDTTHPLFLTLDANGKLTHVNGREISGSGGGGSSPDPATATPLMDGAGAVGASAKYAREDHVHPSDTNKAAATSVPTQASISSAGLITFKNSGGTSLFTLQLPVYDGSVS